jgi:hypothetical protein
MLSPHVAKVIVSSERKKEKLVPLVAHARSELEKIGEEPRITQWYVDVVKKFSELGHTDQSAEFTTQVLERLLRFKNLSELTEDPAEWTQVEEGMWRSTRNYEAFSNNGGKTYKLISENNAVEHKTLPMPEEVLDVESN